MKADSGDTGIFLALLNRGGDGISVGEGDEGIFDLPRLRTGSSGEESSCFLLRRRDGVEDESESDEEEAMGVRCRVLEGDDEVDDELCDEGEWGLSRVLCNNGGDGESSPEEGEETGDGASFLGLSNIGGESDIGIGVPCLPVTTGGGDRDLSL